MANLVVMSGELYYFGKLVWGVLLRDYEDERNFFKLYKDQADFKLEMLPLHLIPLSDSVSVEATQAGPNGYNFTISSAKEKHSFSVKTDEGRTLWLSKLNSCTPTNHEERSNTIYQFRVKVQPSALAEKLDLNGEYLLKIFTCGIALYSQNGDTGTTPSAYNCFLHDILKIDYTSERDKSDLISILQTCGDSLKLYSTDALDIIHIMESRKQATSKKLSFSRKPAIRSKSESSKRKKNKSTSDLDISNSSGDFESIGSWLNWRAQRNSKRTPNSQLGSDRMPTREGAMKCSKSDSLPPRLSEMQTNPSYSAFPPPAVLSRHGDSEEYDYIKDFHPHAFTNTSSLEDSIQYDYVRDFGAVVTERLSRKLLKSSFSSSDEDDDYYY